MKRTLGEQFMEMGVAPLIENLNKYAQAVEELSKSQRSEASRDTRKLFRYGVTIAKQLEEFVHTGRLEQAQRLWLKNTFNRVRELSMVEGLGPLRAAELVEEGVEGVDDLYTHAHKLTRQQLIGLQHFEDLKLTIPHKEVLEIGQIITCALTNCQVVLCGEYRRGRSKSRQVECVIAGESLPNIEDIVIRLTAASLIVDTIGVGPTKFTGICRCRSDRPARRLSIRTAMPAQLPFLVLHHTGPPRFIRRLVRRALERGLSLSESSMYRINFEGKLGNKVSVANEEEIFELLGHPFIPANQRK